MAESGSPRAVVGGCMGELEGEYTLEGEMDYLGMKTKTVLG